MRTALLLLTLVAALSVAPSDARANFNCFQTPDGEHRCACVGADNCSAMQKSHLADLRHHLNLAGAILVYIELAWPHSHLFRGS
jgi:hypothetical protein